MSGSQLPPILLVSHDGLAEALVNAGKMIMGEQENIAYVGLQEGDGLSNFIAKLQEQRNKLQNDQDGIIFLVDIPFGTPWNASVAIKRDVDHIIAGVNLPFYLELLNFRAQHGDVTQTLKASLAVKDQCYRYLGSIEKQEAL